MADLTRRAALLAGVAAPLAGEAAAQTRTSARPVPPTLQRKEGLLSVSGAEWRHLRWARGIEGQRKADLGNGTFLNPIMAGDHPDPSIMKDGPNYYMTFSSFDGYPGVVIWRSQDLVNWTPVTAALKKPIGSVWAVDLLKHQGKFYIYIPARFPDKRSIYVITADRIEGPWSEPIDLNLPAHIDPGHAVGEDGSRWLFLSGGDRVPLSPDGLRTTGPVEHVYDPWKYPESWVVESFSPEGPKITRHGGWYYLITAVGGTSGPPTGHMIIVARSRSIHGPWEDDPNNPVVRTWSAEEKWWSRGHATLVEGPAGDWWSVYHGYENGFWTLGRQTLLDPIEWTADGWFRTKGGDLSKPLPKPRGGRALPHGMALSDDFRTNKLGIQWSFYDPAPTELSRARYEDGALSIAAKGKSPTDASPLACLAGDLAYECEVEVEIDPGADAGLLLFYSRELYAGFGLRDRDLVMHRVGGQRRTNKPAGYGRRMWIRVANDRHIVTIHHSPDGRTWTQHGVRMEVSGYNHNTAWDFLSLRPALYVTGEGRARFRNFNYRALA